MKCLRCEALCYSRPFVHRDNEKESRKNGDIDRAAAGMMTDYLEMRDLETVVRLNGARKGGRFAAF